MFMCQHSASLLWLAWLLLASDTAACWVLLCKSLSECARVLGSTQMCRCCCCRLRRAGRGVLKGAAVCAAAREPCMPRRVCAGGPADL